MSTVVNDFEKIKAEYKSYPDFCDVYTILIDGSTREVDGYTVHDEYLFLSCKLCILRTSLREFLCENCMLVVLAEHFVNEMTIETVEFGFYWPELKRDVAKHVGRCHTCQLAKQ